MTCFIAQNLLSEYIDGDLSPDRLRELETHLGGCDGCQAELSRTRAVRQMLRTMPLEHAPVGFVDRVNDRIRVGSPVRRASSWLSRLLSNRWLYVGATAAVVVVAVVVTNQRGLISLDDIISGARAPKTASPETPAMADAESVADESNLQRGPKTQVDATRRELAQAADGIEGEVVDKERDNQTPSFARQEKVVPEAAAGGGGSSVASTSEREHGDKLRALSDKGKSKAAEPAKSGLASPAEPTTRAAGKKAARKNVDELAKKVDQPQTAGQTKTSTLDFKVSKKEKEAAPPPPSDDRGGRNARGVLGGLAGGDTSDSGDVSGGEDDAMTMPAEETPASGSDVDQGAAFESDSTVVTESVPAGKAYRATSTKKAEEGRARSDRRAGGAPNKDVASSAKPVPAPETSELEEQKAPSAQPTIKGVPYRVRSHQLDAPAQISALVKSLGGKENLWPSGPPSLNEDGTTFTVLQVELPADQLDAFRQGVADLGTEQFQTPAPADAETLMIRVLITYEP